MKQAGAGLIEVLVSLVVLSIGLLGLAGLQYESLRNTQLSFQRSQAGYLLNDMADRMRSNIDAVDGDQYASVRMFIAQPPTNCTTFPGGVGQCNSNQMALADIFLWQQDVLRVFGNANTTTATILCIDPNTDLAITAGAPCPDSATHRITISWSTRRDTAAIRRDRENELAAIVATQTVTETLEFQP